MTFLKRWRLILMPRLRVGIALSCLVAHTVWAGQPASNRHQLPGVKHNIFVSPENPQIRVTVDKKFKYVGSVPFTIDGLAGGNRYVFVHAPEGKHIQRMFIIQQEGFLPTSNDTYKYKITNSATLGRSEYQHSVMLYDNDAIVREAPGKEADVTWRFLIAHGYVLEPELIQVRFARAADSQRKHEIILFCYENLSSHGYKLADFPKDSDSPKKLDIKQAADENCRNAFRVNN